MEVYQAKINVPGDMMRNFGICREEQSNVRAWPRGNKPRRTERLCHESISSGDEEVHVCDDVRRCLRNESRSS
jgi:hypothetical protein